MAKTEHHNRGQFYTHLIHESTLPLRPEMTDIYRNADVVYNLPGNTIEKSLVRHRDLSKQAIKATAQEALKKAPKDKPKTALIIGAGYCDDIPLKWIGYTFDKVNLIEINSAATEGVVEKLPEKVQEKIQIIRADIAGNTGAMLRKINLAKDSASLDEFIHNAGNAISTRPLSGIAPSFGDDYTFVSSQLVMSQLTGLPVNVLESYISETYGRSLDSLSEEERTHLFKDIYIPSSDLIKEHIAYLARSVNPEGTVHLSDTAIEEAPNNSGWMIPPKAVTESISEHFNVLPPGTRQWDWKHRPEHTYKVVAYPLKLKPADRSPC